MMPELKLPGGWRLQQIWMTEDGESVLRWALYDAKSNKASAVFYADAEVFAGAMTRPDGGDSLREAFEKWVLSIPTVLVLSKLDRKENGEYADEQTACAWLGWQAALAAKDGE